MGRDRAESAPPARLGREEAAADLAELRKLLEERFSYLTRKGLGLDAAFAAAASGLGPVVARADLTLRIQMLLARFGDGHTGVRESLFSPVHGHLPFLVAEAEGRFVAFLPDRSGFLDDAHPYLTEIDGRAVEEWVTDAGAVVPRGSPQFHRRSSIRMLRFLPWLRRVADRKPDGPVAAVLSSANGRSSRTVRLPLAPRRPIYGDWPRNVSRVLDGNIGYFRIEDMDGDEAFLHGLRTAMAGFRNTSGLVIDVRGNGGGTRDALRTMLPYLLDPKGPPRVVNVARYRLPPGEERGRRDGYLGNRDLHPATASVWSKADAAVIRSFARRFRPEWTPPKDAFSAPHYMLVRPGGEGVRHYDRPVIVLQDSGCFSATDIFLGAFKGLPNVTLMGTPSGGGSGRSRGHRLANSRIRVRISSMASYRPTGELYEGRGVPPDVTVEPLATDLIGRTDRALAEALSRLR